MLKLDLGAGKVSPEGFSPLGNVNGSSIYPLVHPSGSVDEIRASHVLEHFPHALVPDVLAEWMRVLKPGGVLKVAVPDFARVASNYLAGRQQPTENYVMGGQVDADDFHKALFDGPSLKRALAEAGLVLLRPWVSEIQDCASLPISLNLAGTKPRQAQPTVRAVMTTPRLGFNDMWNCALQALPRLGVELINVSGAFWDQSITMALERVLEEEQPDYLLAIDYDSVFHAGHVAKLIQLAMVHPEVDAIAAVQASRHSTTPLGLVSAKADSAMLEGKVLTVDRAEFEQDLTPATQAHFGLTLIHADKLRALPRPWFLGVPDVDGRWKTSGSTDPDIYFWRQWAKAGFSLCLAPRIVVGHLELMVRWPDENMQPMWQAAKDWEATRQAPAGVWTGEPA